MKKAISAASNLIQGLLRRPGLTARDAATLPFRSRGIRFGRAQTFSESKPPEESEPARNPLTAYFESNKTGRGIFKWTHYFGIYHRHLSRFVGRNAHLLEIGIYSGGSLEMWREYLGEQAHICGVDIEEACRAYENANTSIYIGDQENRDLWRRIKQTEPIVDIVIDDGGHLPEQQIATLEEMLPHIRPGGVYICEDIHGEFNRFAAYVQGLCNNLNTAHLIQHQNRELSVVPSAFQTQIHSVHLYPYVVVIEKHAAPLRELAARRHGSEWQPFT